MKFLHIAPSNKEQLNELNSLIKKGKHAFILVYRNGCPPCEATKPEWAKIKSELAEHYKNNDEIVVADVESSLGDNIVQFGEVDGVPSMRYIKGSNVEEYEKSGVKNKNRSVDSFVEWIESKVSNPVSISTQDELDKRLQKGGKWSRKYKRSINCRRPRGFSQKQYCKYGRKKNRRTKRRRV